MKRIYFLLGTALLLCCFLNVVQAQTDVAATWPLTSDVEGVATSSDGISAADQELSNMATGGYTGVDGSQRIQINGVVDDAEGATNVWPNEQTDTITAVYTQFAVAPDAGNSLTVSSINYDISSSGTNNMRARVFYSTDPTFQTATEIANGSGDADNNVPRDSDADPAVLTHVEAANLNIEVAEGETLYLRVYPWFHNSAADGRQTGKYIHLKNVVISGQTNVADGGGTGDDDAATISWALTTTGANATEVGPLDAGDQTLSRMVRDANLGAGGSQRIRPEGVVADPADAWPADQAEPIGDMYVQFEFSPAQGYTYHMSSLAYQLAARNVNVMKAVVYYSKDPDFADSVQIEDAAGGADDFVVQETANDGNLVDVEKEVDITVDEDETLYIRIYPWLHETTQQTGRFLMLQNVVVAGIAELTGTPCEPSDITLYHQVEGTEGWNQGVASATIDPGQGIVIGPHPNVAEGWSWTGPNGFTADTREIEWTEADGGVTADDAGTYIATYTNECGAESTATFTLNVTGTDPVDPGTDPVNPGDVTIIFVAKPLAEGSPETNDDEQIEWLREQGFNVETYYNATLSTAPQSDIDMLNDADLVIIGRSGSSGDFGGDQKATWNALTTPVILNSQWIARSNRLNWFLNAGDPPHYNEEGEIVHAVILDPTDVVFNDVDLGDDNTIPWLETPSNLLSITGESNGEILAVSAAGDAGNEEGGAILMARFDAGTEFYPAAGDQAAGPRTYFGFGNDNVGYPHFFGLTEEGRQVYLAEINRLTGVSGGTDPDPDPSGPRDVAYFMSNKEMAEGAVDPVREMLEADANINLTVYELADDAVVEDDLSQFDAIVIQEGFNSGAAILQPEGSLALSEIPVPFIYNKTYALRNDRALDTGGGTSAEGAGLGIMVDPANQDHELFEGITFTDDIFPVFLSPAEDNGTTGTEGATKTFNYTSGIDPLPEGTLLASPSETTLDEPNSTVFLNFLPAGSIIGSETIQADGLFVGMNYGAISADGGENMTEEGLQFWRNAVYMMAGVGEVTEPTVSIPSNPTPADDAEDVDTDGLTLTWEGDAETYNVYWGTSEDALELAGEALTTASFSPENVAEGMEYFWRVDGMAEGAETAVGPVWSFTTAGEPSSDATLTDLTLNGTQITGFDAAITEYTINLPAGTESVNIGGTPAAGASIGEGQTGDIELTEGENTHVIEVTAADGTTQTYTITFNVAPTSVAGLASQGVEIYPNPVNGNATLNLRNAAELVTVNVYTAQGVLVRTVTADNSGNISIQVSDLAEGLYLLKAVNKDRSVLTGKFVK